MVAWLEKYYRSLNNDGIQQKFLDLQHLCVARDSAALIDVAKEVLDSHVREVAKVVTEFLAIGREQSLHDL